MEFGCLAVYYFGIGLLQLIVQLGDGSGILRCRAFKFSNLIIFKVKLRGWGQGIGKEGRSQPAIALLSYLVSVGCLQHLLEVSNIIVTLLT